MLKCFHNEQDEAAAISQEKKWTQNAFPGDTGLSCNAFRGDKIRVQQFHKVQDKDAVEWIMENGKQVCNRKNENGKAGLSSHLPQRVFQQDVKLQNAIWIIGRKGKFSAV